MKNCFFLVFLTGFLFWSIFSQDLGAQVVHKNDTSSTNQNSQEQLIAYLFNQAQQHRLSGDYGAAMKADIMALNIAEYIGNVHAAGRAQNSIGVNYYRMGNIAKAETYYNKAIHIAKFCNDTTLMADVYNNFGMLYDDLSEFDNSYHNYISAAELFMKLEIYDGLADTYNGLAGLYYHKGQLDSVEYYAMKAISIFEILENKEAMAFMYINIGALQNASFNHQQAILSIRKGIELAEEINSLNQKRQGYRALSETYAYMNDFKSAFQAMQIFLVYHDSIFSADQANIVEELNVKYETEKTNKELSEKKTELLLSNIESQKYKNTRNITISLLVLVVMVLAFIFIRYKENKKIANILDEKNKQLALLNATKDKFFSLVSHDLKSPVNSFSRMTSGLEKSFDLLDKETLKEYLQELNKTAGNLNDFLKKLLEWALSQTQGMKIQKEKISVEELLRNVIKSHESNALQKNVIIICDCSQDIEFWADRAMTETVIRNLLSNAVKFCEHGTEVRLSAIKNNDIVKISVTNAGPGISPTDAKKLFKIDGSTQSIGNHPEKGTGLGLILCGEFVALHGGKIFVEDGSAKQTTFTVEFPEL